MNTFKLILRSLWFYKKTYLAIFAGAFISITALTGALVVGDSVQYSLERITSLRLGKIRYAMDPGKCFTTGLGNEMTRKSGKTVVAVIHTGGLAIFSENQTRINQVQIYGIDNSFLQFWEDPLNAPKEDEAILSINVAEKLGVKAGDEILLRITKPERGISNAPFVAESAPSVSVRVKVAGIAENNNMGRFSLKSNQGAPFNIFLSRQQLERILGLKGFANLLLAEELKNPDSVLKMTWNPEDAGIEFHELRKNGIMEVSTNRIFFTDQSARAILSSVTNGTSYLSYLVNSLTTGNHSTPYSFVTSTDATFEGENISAGEIILNSWLADDLKARQGDSVLLTYFTMDNGRLLKEKHTGFMVRKIISINDSIWDRSLMPPFPGISDAMNCRDWETGSPVDLKRIRPVDEDYWKKYRGTPKAFISFEDGRKIWRNPYGMLTAIRFPLSNHDLARIKESFIAKSDPAASGLVFLPVYATGKAAAEHATDFGGLFLGLSFFIILAGLLLMGMLFSMQISGRTYEIRTLSALGFNRKKILAQLFPEMFSILLLSGIAGALAGTGYNRIILAGLNTLWNPAVGTSDLVAEVNFSTLLTGALAGIITASFIIFYLLNKKIKRSLSAVEVNTRIARTTFRIAPLTNRTMISRGLQMNRWRNLGITGLIAMGTFVIVITGAYHRTFYGNGIDPKSGTGGFLLWTETSVPLPARLDNSMLQEKFDINLNNDPLFWNARFIPLLQLEGNDASCLNLNHVTNPSVIGVPELLLNGRFTFTTIDPAWKNNFSWKTLGKEISPGIIPGFVDETVLTWGLGKKIGDTLFYLDESGESIGVKLLGALDNSIFQGKILISDGMMRKYFPSGAKYTLMLIEGEPSNQQELIHKIESVFADNGMMVTPAIEQLGKFNAVQNTYLSVFMLLGGLGILLATFGLGFFFIRDLMARQKELALFVSLGFEKQRTMLLATGGYFILLIAGIAIGKITALIAILPLLFSSGYQFPLLLISGMIFIVFLSGMLWIYLPARIILRKNLIASLQDREG